jgi:hypothetical protein
MSRKNNSRLFPITRGKNPLHSLDNKHILAIGTPHGEDLKNAFKNDAPRITTRKERNIINEEDLEDIDPEDFYRGGVKRKKGRQTIRKKKRNSKSRRKSIRRRGRR